MVNITPHPDFYLTTAGDFRPLAEPQGCVVTGRLRNELLNDFMVVDLQHPFSGHGCAAEAPATIQQLILGSKWQGLTLFPIEEWPMPVNVMIAVDMSILGAGVFRFDQVRLIAWGTLHETLKDAMTTAKEYLR